MLEVDGPWHNAASDNARDELLRSSGIDRRRIQRYDSDRCYHDPHGVVSEFLTRMQQVSTPLQTVQDGE
jgi:very-short-patch-repair endonuclease